MLPFLFSSPDEKEKFDPTGFRDSILLGIKESNGDLEALSKFLDVSGSKLDYRRYGESLFDILIAGGLLAPGGSLLTEGGDRSTTTTDIAVFGRTTDDEDLKQFTQVFVRLIRRYKYLEKSLEEDLNKIVVFLRSFSADDRTKLAKTFAFLLAAGHLTLAPLKKLLEQDHLVKEGQAFDFLLTLLKTWQAEKDASTVWTSIRKSALDVKLLDFLPNTKQRQEHFSKCLSEAGLSQLLEYQKVQRVELAKKSFSADLVTQINDGLGNKELVFWMKVCGCIRFAPNETNSLLDLAGIFG